MKRRFSPGSLSGSVGGHSCVRGVDVGRNDGGVGRFGRPVDAVCGDDRARGVSVEDRVSKEKVVL